MHYSLKVVVAAAAKSVLQVQMEVNRAPTRKQQEKNPHHTRKNPNV